MDGYYLRLGIPQSIACSVQYNLKWYQQYIWRCLGGLAILYSPVVSIYS